MNISELIEKLEFILKTYGNLSVELEDEPLTANDFIVADILMLRPEEDE